MKSHFTEEQLTPKQGPLEQKIQNDLQNMEEGKEAYVLVPVELWEDIFRALEIIMLDSPSIARHYAYETLNKMKNL